ncbi:MAG TPA: hypothetical protein VEX87_24050 [Skermanella sp.]|nr:hypothetical protein [Skermanella sp.]
MIDQLLMWAVYRSLDDATGAPYSAKTHRLTATERLNEWRACDPPDDALLTLIQRTYRCNLSQHQPDEPWVTLSGKQIVKSYTIPNADVISKLVSVCDNTMRGLRNRSALLLAWEVIWLAERRDLKLVCDFEVNDLDRYQLSDAASNAVQMWMKAASINSGRVFCEITDDGEVLRNDTLSPEALKSIEKHLAVQTKLGCWNPQLWVDWDNDEPDIVIDSKTGGKKQKKPDAEGMGLVAIVRQLMASAEPPTLPRRLL